MFKIKRDPPKMWIIKIVHYCHIKIFIIAVFKWRFHNTNMGINLYLERDDSLFEFVEYSVISVKFKVYFFKYV